jgi:hypothetical protein
LKQGERVRVGNNLNKSFSEFGTAYEMEDMCEKAFIIQREVSDGRGVALIHPNGNTYVFSKKDVTLLSAKKVRVPKELFDPSNLVEIKNE